MFQVEQRVLELGVEVVAREELATCIDQDPHHRQQCAARSVGERQLHRTLTTARYPRVRISSVFEQKFRVVEIIEEHSEMQWLPASRRPRLDRCSSLQQQSASLVAAKSCCNVQRGTKICSRSVDVIEAARVENILQNVVGRVKGAQMCNRGAALRRMRQDLFPIMNGQRIECRRYRLFVRVEPTLCSAQC